MENLVNNSSNFPSSEDFDKKRVMYSKSGNIKFMSYENVNEVIDELSESLVSRYQLV